MRHIIVLIAIYGMFVALPSSAANVHAFGKNSIIIEGEIVHGDYAKLVAQIDAAGSGINTVSIYSNGGSIFEAIKIGALIRDLRLRTIAPRRFGSHGNICSGISNQKNCTCLSACVLVFAGGIHHYGNVLGVHRSYVGNDFLKYMHNTHGIDASQQLTYTVNDYLQKMGFPQRFIDTMNATRSQNITLLKEVDINQLLSGYIPLFNERVMAKCGNWNEPLRRQDQLDKKRISSGLSAAEKHQYVALRMANMRSFQQCKQTAEINLREEVFDQVMQQARKNVSNHHKGFW